MTWKHTTALLTAAVVAVAAPARAQTTFAAFLTGAQEVPARATTATGFGTVVLNAARTQITVNLQFVGLTTAFNNAHIHSGAFGVNGGVTFNLVPSVVLTNAGLNGSVTNALFDITLPQAATLESGGMYFNVHSTTYPGGEIRGQLSVVPEPASVVLLATGLAGIGLLVRRRRTS